MVQNERRPGSNLAEGLNLLGSNQSAMRDYNERLILTVLRSAGPKPKAEVARLIGLSPQTASVIMRSLEERQLIERCDPVRGKVGQPSIPMRLAKNGALFFGLKIGRRSADLVVCDFLGQIIAQVRSTYDYPTPDGAVRFVTKGVEQLTAQLSARQRQRIAGLGIAFPSYLWEWTGIIGAPYESMSGWQERDICREIGACIGVPVYCQNDAACACGAELVFGTRDRPASFLHIFVGYFVGGGIVLDNRLIAGPTGNACALGPMPIHVAGNKTRQLVEVASLASLEKLVQKSGGDFSTIWERPSAWSFDRKTTRKWLEQAAEGLAHAIVSACSVFDFELVLVDGWLPEEVRCELVELIEKSISTFDLTGLVRPIIREGSAGPDARSIGAATLPLAARFLISQGNYSVGGDNLLSVERFKSQTS